MLDNYNTGDRPFISYGDRIRDLEQELTKTKLELMDTNEQLQVITQCMFEQLGKLHKRITELEAK